jgi:hypothetical protein
MKMAKRHKTFGKWEGTYGIGNKLFIKKFNQGVALKKRKGGEIELSVDEVWEMIMYLRKFGRRNGFGNFMASWDLTFIWKKYPETKEFIERLSLDKINLKEREKIQEEYNKNQRIKRDVLNELKDE